MFKTSKDYTIYEVKLLKIIQEASQTFTYIFSKPDNLNWSEGAHTHLALDNFDEEIGWWQKKDVRHLSIMTLSSENVIAMTTRMPEPHSEFKDTLKRAEVGDSFYVFKVGSRLRLRRNNSKIVLLSSGVGIATLRPLVKAYKEDSNGISDLVHINVDSSKEYLFKKEFDDFSNNLTNFSNQFVDSRESFYFSLSELLMEGFQDSSFYIVGSDEFIIEVTNRLREFDVEDHQLVLDKKEHIVKELILA